MCSPLVPTASHGTAAVALSPQSCSAFHLCREDLSLLNPLMTGSRSQALRPEAQGTFSFLKKSNFLAFSCLQVQGQPRSFLLYLLLFQLLPATNLSSACRAGTSAFVLKGNIPIRPHFFSDPLT